MGLLHSCLYCGENNQENIPFTETAGGSLTRYICMKCIKKNKQNNEIKNHHEVSRQDVT